MEQLSIAIFLKDKVEGSLGGQMILRKILFLTTKNYLQSLKSFQELYPQIKGKVKNKTIFLSTIDVKDNTFNLAVVEPKFKKIKSVEDYKDSWMKTNLDHVNVVDTIKLHKQIREMIFTDLL